MDWRRIIMTIWGIWMGAGITVAFAAEESSTEKEALQEEEEEDRLQEEADSLSKISGIHEYGINIDMSIASIYNYRGINVFQERGQQEANGGFFPSLTWTVPGTGLYLGYWGAYQFTGENQAEMVRSGIGHEQDLFVGYAHSILDDRILLEASLTWIAYPFASESVTGTKLLSFLDPMMGITLFHHLDMSLHVSYLAELGDGASPFSYLYIRPAIGRSLVFGDIVGMDLSLGFGAKVWTDEAMRNVGNNVLDVLFEVRFPISIPGGMYVIPGMNVAWTNLDQVVEDDGSTRNATVGDEFMVYGSLSIGAEF